MTHEQMVAALKGERAPHDVYPIRRPLAVVTDPRNVSKPADWPRIWR